MAEVSSLIVQVKADGVNQTIQSLDKLGDEAQQAETAARNLSSGLKTVSATSNVVRGNFGMAKNATQQLSYQLQDVAVQAQMGTDAFRILAQQGPQIASIFGPGGAVFGAIIAFGSLIAGTLVSSLITSEEETEDLDEAMSSLKNTIVEVSGEFAGLSEQYDRFAKSSRAVTIAMAAREVHEQQKIIAAAGQSVITTYLDVADALDLPIDSISSLVHIFSRADKAIDEADGSLTAFLNTTYTKQPYLTKFQEQMRFLMDNFGASADQAYEFSKAAAAVYKETSPETISRFNQQAAELSLTAGSASHELLSLTKTLDEADRAATKAGNAMAAFQRVMDTGDVAPELFSTKERIKEEEKALDAALIKKIKANADYLQKREDQEREAAQKRIELESSALQVVNRLQDAHLAKDKSRAQQREQDAAKRLAQALMAGMSPIALMRANLEAQLNLLEQDRLAAITSAEQKGQDILAIEMMYDQARINLTEQTESQITQITQREEQLRAQIKAAAEQMAIARAQAVAGQLTSITMQAFGEQSAAAKAMFALQQALAMAQIIVSTEMAAMNASAQASALGGLAGFLSTQAAIRAMGAISLGIVAGQTIAGLTGRALGGQVRGGQSYIVGERGPELLTMGTSGRIASNDQLRTAMRETESSNNNMVTVNFAIQANDTQGFDRLLQSRRGQIVTMMQQAFSEKGRKLLA